MNDHLYAVIMAGGIGSRLWPRSRAATPKQFLDLVGSRTMLQETVERIEPLVPLERVLVVVGEEHRKTVLEQVPGLPEENVLLEPGPRGTAPCIGLAGVVLRQRDVEATMAVFPADHRIADAAGFREAVVAADEVAQEGYLVTLGIEPDHPNTGYGYIERGSSLHKFNGHQAYEVKRFTEKPDEERARAFVESGDYYWNGGIFIWKIETILNEMEDLLPSLSAELERVAEAWPTSRRKEVLKSAWEQVPQTTIDYGIMEKASRVATVPIDVGWDDVGNWATLSALLDSDDRGNVIRGKGKVLLLDTKDSYVYVSQGRMIATIGLEDFVVVDTPDALLICPKDEAQAVRDVVQELDAREWEEYL
ncbi:MAG: sugar phosphate nucleotidyltransferase [Anaerolineae bacterium]|nr:sugar phosphate nucleotidyltransferase [Anaerolineae bacterium]